MNGEDIYHESFNSMGSRLDIVLFKLDKGFAENVLFEIKRECYRIENLLSRYVPHSDISKINTHAFQKPVVVSDELIQILNECIDYYNRTMGFFDVTLLPLLNFWKIEKGAGKNDGQIVEDIADILPHIGCNKLLINDQLKEVSFATAHMSLDFGAFGKGYALDKINYILKKYHIADAFVNFGDSSILALGTHPYGDCWKVGIYNKFNKEENIHTFKVLNGAVSTSGSIYLDKEGKTGHVVNSKTGFPVSMDTSISVMANNSVEAEVLSTAFLCMTMEERKKVISNFDVQAIEIDYSDKDNPKLLEI